ncbi:MAG: hypothetical protein COB20_10050 [SAR86 cluster bacterium]|uniref:DUF4252 domain-containing protein n=1 Tax=SAR86 cluster bacterium TaxID=2030880 RepID=A0A2A4X297_9GAMM|nr:MAG: hypothetical protein COB20_10050 [SAR86 cluster bacterium]
MKKILLIILLTQLTACMSFSDRPFRSARNSIEEQVPNIRLDKEFAISIGNSMLTFLDVVSLNEADISELDHVQVAVYNVESGGQKIDFNEIDFSDTLRSRGKNLHWETIVKVREDGDQVWVLVGMDRSRNSLDAVSVFILENSELVMINVDGDFDHMIEFALKPASDSRRDRDAG